jgi:hypothetical protein
MQLTYPVNLKGHCNETSVPPAPKLSTYSLGFASVGGGGGGGGD